MNVDGLGGPRKRTSFRHKEFTTPMAMHLVIESGRIVRMHLYEDPLTVTEAFNAG